MDGFRIFLFLFYFFRFTPGAQDSDFLQITPERVVVKFGTSVSVNCSTNITHKGMGWEVSEEGVPRTDKVQLITWKVPSLTHWDIRPICYININISNIYQEELKITVYKPPDRVSISTVNHTGPMTEGREYELLCEVEDVAPLHHLNVTWYKGETPVKKRNDFYNNKKGQYYRPGNVSDTLQIVPNRADDGVQYRCEAELDLESEEKLETKVKSAPLNLTVHFDPDVSNCPPHLWLEEGESLKDYCNITGNPVPDYQREKDGQRIDPHDPLNRTSTGNYTIIVNERSFCVLQVSVMYGPHIICPNNMTAVEGKHFNPFNCTADGYPPPEMKWFKNNKAVDFPKTLRREDAGTYVLIASNNKTSNHTVEIEVHYPPKIVKHENVLVNLGNKVVLICNSSANPRPVYNWTFYEAPNVIVTSNDGVSQLVINAANEYNIGSYTCTSSNSLGEDKHTVRVDIKGAKAKCPLTFTPSSLELEYGKNATVRCDAPVPPLELICIFSDSIVLSSTLNETFSVSYSFFVHWNETISCSGLFSELGMCDRNLDVTLYKPPERVSISTVNHAGPMTEGRQYELRCDVQNVAPLHLLNVIWYKGETLVKNESFPVTDKSPKNQTATLQIVPSRSDNELQYRCESRLTLKQEKPPTMRSDPLRITVHYKPSINKDKLPETVPVFHGYPEVIVCEADGNPKPIITWTSNTNDRTEGGNLTIKDNVGVYNCTATNSAGTDYRVVTVVMKAARCSLKLTHTAVMVEYGTSVSVDCSNDAEHVEMEWNASQGAVKKERVQLITWRVDRLTHWDIQPVCQINMERKCSVDLQVTVYKLPQKVSISTVGHTGPMIENRQYELQCDIQNVAPVHLLRVNWYKGQHLVAKTSFSDSTKTPVNQSTILHMSVNRADDGVQYRCEAELQVTRTGTQPIKVSSQVLGITVHYTPQITRQVEIVNQTADDDTLNCTVTANPSPKYTWHSAKTQKEFNVGRPVLALSVLTSGNYTCTASNGIGTVTKLFIVQTKPKGNKRTVLWAIVGSFVGLAVVMIVGYVLKKRTEKK